MSAQPEALWLADDWQKKLQAANVIRQHMEGKA